MTRATTAGRRRSPQGFISVLLFLMPVVASLGSAVSIGGFATARPLAAILVVVTFLVTPRWNRVSTWIVVLVVRWLVWGLVIPHGMDTFKRLFSIALSLASVLAFVLYPWTRKRLRLLGRAWLFAWIVAVIPAIYEIVSGKHLPNYLSGSPGWVREFPDDIASYFINPNPFAYLLCTAMAVLIMASRLERRRVRNMMLVYYALSPVIIYPTNSRLVLAVLLVMLVWMVATREIVRPRPKLLTAVSMALVMVAVVVLISSLAVMNRIFNSFEGLGSDRLKLYMNAVWTFLSTLGLGIGPGMFENTMRCNRVLYIAYETANPHSGVFEILSQYGFLIAVLVGAALVAVAWRGIRDIGRIDEAPEYRMIRQGVVITAIMTPVLSFGNSTFLDSPIVWIQVATLLGSYCAYRQIARPVPKWARDSDPEVLERFRVVRRTLAADRRGDEPVAVPAG